ncbi:MAG: hypothetical protein WC155_07285 [Candidatus Cloacimonadales bacterium]
MKKTLLSLVYYFFYTIINWRDNGIYFDCENTSNNGISKGFYISAVEALNNV